MNQPKINSHHGGSGCLPFSLKTSPRVVSSSCSIEAWVIMTGAFFFRVKESLGMLATVVIFLAISASSALMMLDNILPAKKTSKWLITIPELFSPRGGNEEYHYKLSKHQGCTLWSTRRRCQKPPSSSLGTHRFLGLLAIGLPGVGHSEI